MPRAVSLFVAILGDPEASPNDRGVALAMLKNAEVSSRYVLPFCQDTGTATIIGKKGQQVWTGVRDEEHLSRGVFDTYSEENLRYSQTVPLTTYEEKNSGNNLPAQIDLYATEGMEYRGSPGKRSKTYRHRSQVYPAGKESGYTFTTQAGKRLRSGTGNAECHHRGETL